MQRRFRADEVTRVVEAPPAAFTRCSNPILADHHDQDTAGFSPLLNDFSEIPSLLYALDVDEYRVLNRLDRFSNRRPACPSVSDLR